jgi:hypothetical protein
VRREIFTTVVSVPFMTLLTTPVFLFEVRGYSKLTEGMDLSTTQGILHEVSLPSQYPLEKTWSFLLSLSIPDFETSNAPRPSEPLTISFRPIPEP